MLHVQEYEELTPASCDGRCENPAVIKSLKKVIAQVKLDGHRALLHSSMKFSRSYLTSRRISVKTDKFAENGLNVPHIIDSFLSFIHVNNFGYTVLDGEIVIPDRTFESVQTVMGSAPEVAISWQDMNEKAVFKVFDVLFLDGKDIRKEALSDRNQLLNELFDSITVYPYSHMGYLELVPSYSLSKPEEIQSLFDSVVSAGGEGLVLKDPNQIYGRSWTKMKKVSTYDVVVTGFLPGKGKFRNMVGAVCFGIYADGKLLEIGRCSGMSDGHVQWVTDTGESSSPNRKGSWIIPSKCDQPKGSRAWFTENMSAIKGTVIEVEGNGLTKYGAIRHPRFVRLRPDKDPKDCTKLKE